MGTTPVYAYGHPHPWSRHTAHLAVAPGARLSVILSSDVGEFFAGAIPGGGYGSRATSTTRTQIDYVRVWPLG